MTGTIPSKKRNGLPPWSVHFHHQPGVKPCTPNPNFADALNEQIQAAYGLQLAVEGLAHDGHVDSSPVVSLFKMYIERLEVIARSFDEMRGTLCA